MNEKTLGVQEILRLAFKEDLPSGDITTEGLGLTDKQGTCRLVAKQNIFLSGSDFFSQAMLFMDSTGELNWFNKDSDLIKQGNVVCEIKGNLIQFLKAERVGLNLLGHLSGIATLTHSFVAAAPNIRILDTRKTLPLYREYEKRAVCDGGGSNHRMNLSDAILIKENHIFAAGSLKVAIDSIKKNHKNKEIEIEVKNLAEVKQAIELGAHRLLLDNMTNVELEACLKIIPAQVMSEASGNMTVERVKSIANLNLDFISVGAITHSAPTADFSLLFDWS